METFAFISRHEPTAEQISLAQAEGIELIHVGDCDAFTVGPSFVDHKGAFEGVVVVHPAAALRLCSSFVVGIFENSMRSEVGKQSFYAKSFNLYDLRD